MNTRPDVISIAGFDPSAGAGVLADIKTFEQHNVMGLGVTTGITYQTGDQFYGMEWLDIAKVVNQLRPLLDTYEVKAIKIGLIQLDQLRAVLEVIPDKIPVIWDPILNASSGFDFKNGFDIESVPSLLPKIDLVTPNLDEFNALNLEGGSHTSVLLKGGHNQNHKNDELISTDGTSVLIEGELFDKSYQKHGTGCVLSAAITSNIALDNDLVASCTSGKKYVERLLKSNDGLLGYHS